jgi:hypothetical protein
MYLTSQAGEKDVDQCTEKYFSRGISSSIHLVSPHPSSTLAYRGYNRRANDGLTIFTQDCQGYVLDPRDTTNILHR